MPMGQLLLMLVAFASSFVSSIAVPASSGSGLQCLSQMISSIEQSCTNTSVSSGYYVTLQVGCIPWSFAPSIPSSFCPSGPLLSLRSS